VNMLKKKLRTAENQWSNMEVGQENDSSLRNDFVANYCREPQT
jgi:hypothetical protein